MRIPRPRAAITPEELRDEIRRRAASSTGDQWALIEARDGRDDPVLVRLNSSLKRIDHPYAGHHLEVVLERGFDAAADTAEREAIDRGRRRAGAGAHGAWRSRPRTSPIAGAA